jgi:methyl-accepting chemotaxis protein
MTNISASLGKVASVSSSLSEKVQQVDGIIETVGFLADQSSTLAINAGIEASRAGEAGKGFSAVAREMRALASDSRKATVQIREILQEIRQKTVQVDSSVAAGSSIVDEGVRLVHTLGDAISQLGVTIHDAVGLMRQVEGSRRRSAPQRPIGAGTRTGDDPQGHFRRLPAPRKDGSAEGGAELVARD